MHPFDDLLTRLADRPDLQESIGSTTTDDAFKAALGSAAADLGIEISDEDMRAGMAAIASGEGNLDDSQLEAVVGGAGTLFRTARTFLGSVADCQNTCQMTSGEGGLINQTMQCTDDFGAKLTSMCGGGGLTK